ncbi:MAG: 16S rRNA (guanine(966)-N(2))-methyltransferase RsmD [Bacillota bacterium]|nr:16S rRNA (guanine(966)-N(2))-methyltransferase RsmD [Bacillota bacterium]
MRIISGQEKGRKLKAPKGFTTRPTTDRVKEAIFNILGDTVVNSAFLDLFGGSGAIAIEAISRGAAKAVISEKDTQALRIIKENIASTGFGDKIRCLKLDALVTIELLRKEGKKFNLIFLDPPYESGLITKSINAIEASGILATGGYVVAEASKKEELDLKTSVLSCVKKRAYGDTVIYILQILN